MRSPSILIAVLIATCFLSPAHGAAATHEASTAASTQAIVFPPVTAKMREFSSIGYALDFVSPLYAVALLCLVLGTGLSARIRDAARKVTAHWFGVLCFYLAGYMLAALVLNAPMYAYSYWLDHHFGLSNERVLPWMGDLGKGLLLTYGERLAVFALVFFLMQRFPRRWEFWLWVSLIPVIVVAVFAEPVVVDPLFNKFTPLPAGTLRTRIEALAARAGIPNAPIVVSEVSKQTEETNAYVDGVGSSARIVLWDTTLKKMPEDEIISIVGHEMGHYVHKDINWGCLETIAGLLIALPIVRRLYEWLLARCGDRWRLQGPLDAAAVPVFLLVYFVLNFLASPIINAASRRIEHNADAYGLSVTGNRVAMAKAFILLSQDNLSDPNPPAFVQFWYGSHPTLQQRVDFVLGRSPGGR